MGLKKITPDECKILPMYENFYAYHFSLADLVALGPVATINVLISGLAKTETIQQVQLYCKDTPDAPGISGFTATVGGVNGTVSTATPLGFKIDISNQMTTGDVADGNIGFTATTYPAIATRTLGTLTDSVLGSCTPQAVVSTTSASYVNSAIAQATVNSRGFNGTGRSLIVKLQLAGGSNFEDMTDGNFWIYVWTKQIPADMVS